MMTIYMDKKNYIFNIYLLKMTTKQKYTIVNGEKIPSNVINKSLYAKIKKKNKKKSKS